MSQHAWGKGRALLEALGLSTTQIAKCYGMHPLNEEESVQHGLQVWVDGGANTTWEALLKAMETAGIAVQQREGLKEELCSNTGDSTLAALFLHMFVYVCALACVLCIYMCVCACTSQHILVHVCNFVWYCPFCF